MLVVARLSWPQQFRITIGFALFYCAMATSSEKSAAPPDFSNLWKCSDVVLVVEDQKFHVHRCTLAMWSPVFAKMFTSEVKEKIIYPIIPGKAWKTVTK